MKISDRTVYLLMILTALFWAGAFVGGKIAVAEFPPFTLTFIRFLIATAILIPLMLRLEPGGWRIARADIPAVVFLGLSGMAAYHVLFFYALKYTTAINTGLIASTSPVMTTLLAALLVGETLGLQRAGAMAVAFGGVLLTISGGDLDTLRSVRFNPGDLFMIAASVAKSLYIVYSRRIAGRYSPLVLTTYSFGVCVLATLPFALFENPASFLPQTTSAGWWAIVYMAVCASCVGYLIQQFSIKAIGAAKTTSFEYLATVFIIILSALILSEAVTPLKLISAAIIMAGVYWNTTIKSRPLVLVKG